MGIKDFFIKQAVQKWADKIRKDAKIMKFLENKKSYICWAVVIASTALDLTNGFGWTHIAIPDVAFKVIDIVFGTLGIGSRIETQARLNALIAKVASQVK